MRVFRCFCGHKMRFGAACCGYCGNPAPFFNRRAVWLAAYTVAGAAIALLLTLAFR